MACYFSWGDAAIALRSGESTTVQASDLVFVPRGGGHTLSPGPGHAPGRSAPVPGGSGEAGFRGHFLHVTMQAAIDHDCPFQAALPPLLVLKAGERGEAPYLENHL